MTHRNGIFTAFFLLLVGCAMGDAGSVLTNGQGGAASGVGSGPTGAGGVDGGQGGHGGEAGGGASGGAGGAGAACDAAGMCGDYSSGCSGCAAQGVCAMAYDGCFNDASCVDFNVCTHDCGSDVACQTACAAMNPLGAERYNELVTCIVCQACPSSCADFNSLCP
jgi:hypothetical protein